MKKKILLLSLMVSIFSLFAEKTLQKTLNNGMEVVVKENTTNNSVAFYCFVKTGSIHEGEYMGKGLSHYLEHIVSSGTTTKRTEEEYTKWAQKMGAISNAYTIFGATVYQIQVESQFEDEALQYISENIQYCTIDSAEVAREKDVIVKEFVMRVSPPMAQLRNKNRAVTFLKSNTRNEVIGDIDLFKSVKRSDLVDYYKKRYMPNNMIFVAAGNFEAEDMMDKIENAFKDYKRGVLDPIALPEEPVRVGEYRYVNEFDIQNPVAFINKVVDKANYRDFPAIEMAIEILMGKRTAPVRYKLYEEMKKVNYIFGYFNNGGMLPETMVQLGFETKDPEDLDNIVNLVDQEIENVYKRGVTKEEIKDVISKMKAQHTMNVPNADADCQRIGWNMMDYGKPEVFEEKLAEFEKLTPKMVNNAIKKYLMDKNRVIFYGVPRGAKSNFENNEVEVVKTEIVKETLDDDVTLIQKTNSTDPVVYGEIIIPNISTEYQDEESYGTLDFMVSAMVDCGSEYLNSIELSTWLEDHAATLKFQVGRDGLYISYTVIKDDVDKINKIILSILNDPTFAKKDVELLREQYVSSYERSLSDPGVAHKEFRKSVLYNGVNAVTEETINNRIKEITVDQLKELHEDFIKGESLVYSLFGDITLDKAKEIASDFRENMPEGDVDFDKNKLIIPDVNELYENPYSFEQVNIDLNFMAPSLESKDFMAMLVLNEILSGQGSNRLHKATRGVNNLAYFAYSQYSWSKEYGYLRITSQTSLQNKDELIKVLKKEVKRLQDGELTQEEIKKAAEARSMLFSSYLTDDKIAGISASYEVRGAGYDFLINSIEKMKEVTPEMVKEVANKYLKNVAVIVSYPNKDVNRVVE
ncbi:MAG: hypothetical protein CR982_08820 [Candidatus Cloacimonadota bacterium]|nr:MAG: hypothetical protein CR982_08820 [Candidatus Cloacimonadota bacterium]PIE77736.1 MAG: hypothetical protein CSA15_11475 [Candidatus Delongbacteria bacterium]